MGADDPEVKAHAEAVRISDFIDSFQGWEHDAAEDCCTADLGVVQVSVYALTEDDAGNASLEHEWRVEWMNDVVNGYADNLELAKREGLVAAAKVIAESNVLLEALEQMDATKPNTDQPT